MILPPLELQLVPDDTLRYESRALGSLEPGEVIWWEDAPAASIPTAEWYLAPLGWLGALAVLSGVGLWIAFRDALVMLLWVLCVLVASLLVVGLCWWGRRRHLQELPHTLYRITTRRIMRIRGEPARRFAEARHDDVRGFTWEMQDSRLAKFSFSVGLADDEACDAVIFDSVAPDALCDFAAHLPALSGRRRRFRRAMPMRPTQKNLPDEVARMSQHDSQINPALILQDDEVVLWTGRPHLWDVVDRRWLWSRMQTLLWLMIPTAILLARVGVFGERFADLYLIFVALAAVWLAVGLYRILIHPFVVALRRARTRYLLTNLRAITISRSPPRRRVASAFLDMVSSATLEENSDGSGDIHLGLSGGFERVDDARDVYDRVISAIRAAGGSAPEAVKEDSC